MSKKILNKINFILNEKAWISDVKTKWSSPEGLFTKSGNEIAKVLISSSNSFKQAISRLNFYRNRAGKNLNVKDKKRLSKALKIIQKYYE